MFQWLSSAVGRWFSGGEAAPETKAPRGATLAAAITPGATGPGNPAWNEYETRRHHVEWVYAAVRATSQRIAGQPIKVGRKVRAGAPSGSKRKAMGSNPAASGADVRELPAHALHELLDQPNAYMTEAQLIALVVAALEVSGTAFLWFDEQPKGQPNLWFIPSGWVREDPDAELPLTRFIVRPENSADEFDLDASELMRISYPDPANPFQSLSPLKAAFRSVRCDEQIIDSQVSAFANGGRPGLLVRVGRDASQSGIGDADDAPALTQTQRRVLTQRIKEATSGAANSGEPIILDAIIKEVDRISNTPEEMDFQTSSLLTRDRVLAAFGVPKVVLGMTDDANRASAVVSDEHFCFNKCAPICRLLSDHLTNFFRVHYEDPELVVWVEPPRPRDPDGRRADLQQLIGASAITVDELRAEHGLDPLPGGAGKALVKTSPAAAPQPDPATAGDRPPDGGGRRGVWDLLNPAERRAVFHRHAAHRNGRSLE
jgi:phage portal protein BeeE